MLHYDEIEIVLDRLKYAARHKDPADYQNCLQIIQQQIPDKGTDAERLWLLLWQCGRAPYRLKKLLPDLNLLLLRVVAARDDIGQEKLRQARSKGAKVRNAAGVDLARENLQKRADEVWARRPWLSKTTVAELIAGDTENPDTIRRVIRKLSSR
jgi:hypothetical protein